MPSNVEIKARVGDPDGLYGRAVGLAEGGPEVLDQEDVFFNAPRGRLKLRSFGGGGAELIYYERPDRAGPKSSTYHVLEVQDVEGAKLLLSAAFGVRGTVSKRRTLFMAGQTRIHLDRVEGLGDFMELEVVLRPGQTAGEGEEVARGLMRSLEIEPGDLIDGAYIDLLDG